MLSPKTRKGVQKVKGRLATPNRLISRSSNKLQILHLVLRKTVGLK